MMKKKRRRGLQRVCMVLLCLAVIVGSGVFKRSEPAAAAARPLLLSQVKRLALANSSGYKKTKSKLALKEVSYKQAVKSLTLKKKNMSTFRWTPLLSFKFPEKRDLVDESEYVYKPSQIMNEITSLKHKLTDEIYASYEASSNLYTKCYGHQQRIAFLEEQTELLKETLQRNQARLLLGEAAQADVDSIEKSLEAKESELAAELREFENAKKDLGDLIDLDITTGYVFNNPFLDAAIPRSELDGLVEYTLANDQAYYEAKLATALAYLMLDTNYDLIKGQYGGKVGMISPYIQQAKNGEKLDGEAFKSSYDKFLKAIDEPWQGSFRILFIKIPKEWFKGAISGVRYVEDEPYALYESALEYLDKDQEQKDMAKSLEKTVRSNFESLVSARNSYLTLKKQVEQEKEGLQKSLLLNSLGEMTFEEYTEAQNQYEALQMDELEALEVYTTLLYSYDRLTCGGITQYLEKSGITLEGAEGGSSYVADAQIAEGAKYYIRTIVEDNMFELGIYLPENFETDITHFELWCDGRQIGERTEIKKTLRHLSLTVDEVERVFLRLYNDSEFVDDCDIDPGTYQGDLMIVGGYLVKEQEGEREIGTYSIEEMDEMSMVKIKLDIDASEGAAYYSLQNQEGKFILKTEPVPLTEPFSYLDFLSSDLEGIVIKCFDEEQNPLYDAYFKPSDFGIYTSPSADAG